MWSIVVVVEARSSGFARLKLKKKDWRGALYPKNLALYGRGRDPPSGPSKPYLFKGPGS